MPRKPRTIVPGYPHHITQRGNNHQDVFFTVEDRGLYLSLLKLHAVRYGLDILGYCLMTNHVHLVGVPRDPEAVARTIGRTHWKFTQVMNHLHKRSGHLWQGRFYCCALDVDHFLRTMAYIERNPVRAKMVEQAWEYRWSSARAHIEGNDELGMLNLALWTPVMPGGDWKTILSRVEDKEFVQALQLHSRRSRPLGSDSFMSKLEALVGHRLRPLPVGRPKRAGEIQCPSSHGDQEPDS